MVMEELSTGLNVDLETENRIGNAIINGIFGMNTIEFRVICALASQVPRIQNDKTIYSISVKEIGELMSLNPKSRYVQLATVCREIAGKTVVVEFSKNKKSKAWMALKWFDFILYNNSVITFKFANEIQPYLTFVQKAYVTIPTRLLMQFRSFYAIRLFLLVRQWYELNQQTKKLTLYELKYLFGIGDKYKSYTDLSRFVLVPAVKEVEQLTKLRISYTPEKSKTKVTGIVLNITEEAVDTVVVIDDGTNEKEIRARELMSQCRCNERTINRLISQHSLERIIHWAKYTLDRNGIKNPAAYLTEMLRKSYEGSELAVAEPPKVVRAPVPAPIEPSEEEKTEKLRKEDIFEETFRKFKSLSAEEQVQIYDEVLRRADGFKKRMLAVYSANTIGTQLLYRNVFLEYYAEMMGDKINDETS
ncbi:MAG: replication initiation protein [Phascolarctobacterium sp.]|nr:replication initiation protein [Phascolarctobacterium sp.]